LVQDSMGTFLGRHATVICVLLRTTGMFIYSQSLIDNDICLDLAMVEARRYFRLAS
jgi:hypothetical protein